MSRTILVVKGRHPDPEGRRIIQRPAAQDHPRAASRGKGKGSSRGKEGRYSQGSVNVEGNGLQDHEGRNIRGGDKLKELHTLTRKGQGISPAFSCFWISRTDLFQQ